MNISYLIIFYSLIGRTVAVSQVYIYERNIILWLMIQQKLYGAFEWD